MKTLGTKNPLKFFISVKFHYKQKKCFIFAEYAIFDCS